jgi:hypothetical protein
MDYDKLRQGFGVAEVEASSFFCLVSWRREWTVRLEQDEDGAGLVIAWSKSAQARAGDVLLAVDGQLVYDKDLKEAEALLSEALLRDSTGKVRLLVDTSRAWVGGGSRRRSRLFKEGWIGKLTVLANGCDLLLDAEDSPARKVGLNALAMLLLLLPLVESYFSSYGVLARKYGPLALGPRVMLPFELLWRLCFLLSTFLLSASYLALHAGLYPYAAGTLRRAAVLLHALTLGLGLPMLVAVATMMLTGFTLPPLNDDVAIERELQVLVTQILLLVVLPFFLYQYLQRFARFAAAAASLAEARPKLLTLSMPISSHFGGDSEDDQRTFRLLRESGY